MYAEVVLLLLVVPLVLLLASVPLLLGLIPPNRDYGLRTPKTLSSPQVWYPANKFCGVSLTITAIVTAIGLFVTDALGLRIEDDPGAALAVVLIPVSWRLPRHC